MDLGETVKNGSKCACVEFKLRILWNSFHMQESGTGISGKSPKHGSKETEHLTVLFEGAQHGTAVHLPLQFQSLSAVCVVHAHVRSLVLVVAWFVRVLFIP